MYNENNIYYYIRIAFAFAHFNIYYAQYLPLAAFAVYPIWQMRIVVHVFCVPTMDRRSIPSRQALCHRENMQLYHLLSSCRTNKIQLRPSTKNEQKNCYNKLEEFALCTMTHKIEKKITFLMLHFCRSLNGHDWKLSMRFFSRKKLFRFPFVELMTVFLSISLKIMKIFKN